MPCLGTWNTRKIFWKIEILTCFENMTANIYAFLSFSLSGLATWQGIFISICYPKRLSMTHHMIETTTNIIWNLLRSHLGSSPNPDTSNLTRRNSLDAIRSFLHILDFLFILGSTRLSLTAVKDNLVCILWRWRYYSIQWKPCSSRHQILIWNCFWFDKLNQSTNSETAMLSS